MEQGPPRTRASPISTAASPAESAHDDRTGTGRTHPPLNRQPNAPSPGCQATNARKAMEVAGLQLPTLPGRGRSAETQQEHTTRPANTAVARQMQAFQET